MMKPLTDEDGAAIRAALDAPYDGAPAVGAAPPPPPRRSFDPRVEQHRLVEAKALESKRAAARSWQHEVYRQAKKNAAHREIPWKLSWDDFCAVVARADGKCEVSGIPFEFDDRGRGRRRPFIPSLDRKLSEFGYTIENVRLVAAIVNQALSEWGDAPLHRLVAAMSGLPPAQSRDLPFRDVTRRLQLKTDEALELLNLLVREEDYTPAPCRCLYVRQSGITKMEAYIAERAERLRGEPK